MAWRCFPVLMVKLELSDSSTLPSANPYFMICYLIYPEK